MPGVHAVVTHGRTCRCTSTATSPPSASRRTSRCSPKDEVRYKGQPIAVVAADDEETAARGGRPHRDRVRGAPGVHSTSARRSTRTRPKIHQWGNWYPHFEGEMDRRQIRKGDIDVGLRERGHDRPGRLPPGRDRARPDRDAGLPGRPGAERPADDLLVHAGALLLDGRRRRAPAGAAQQAEVRRRHDRRRLRREGRHRDRDDVLAARAQVGQAGEVALDARGGVPLLVHPRAVAHGGRGRGHEGRLDPRPQDAHPPRRRAPTRASRRTA